MSDTSGNWALPQPAPAPTPSGVPAAEGGGGWERYGELRQGPTPTGTDGFAIAGLILGILPIFAGILGIVFGLIGRSRTSRTGQNGKGMATAGAILGTLWLVGVIAVVSYGAATEADRATTGALISSGDVSTADVRLGDCVTELPDGRVTTIGVVPCDRPHLGEVYEVWQLPGDEFPGDDEVQRFSEGRCGKVLPVFLGLPAGKADGYDVNYLYPLASSWRLGDRAVTCILSDPSGASLRGSAAGRGALVPGAQG